MERNSKINKNSNFFKIMFVKNLFAKSKAFSSYGTAGLDIHTPL